MEGLEMFKVETDDEGQPIDNALFYGISAKRYTIYDYNSESSEIKVRKYSAHGLGHLQNIDYKTGKTYPNEIEQDTRLFWKPLSRIIHDYVDHPESKSEGDTGAIKRKHIIANRIDVSYIGKESNELDETQTIGVNHQYTEYSNMEAMTQKLVSISPKEAQLIGISKSQYYDIIRKFKNGEFIRLSDKVYQRIKSI